MKAKPLMKTLVTAGTLMAAMGTIYQVAKRIKHS